MSAPTSWLIQARRRDFVITGDDQDGWEAITVEQPRKLLVMHRGEPEHVQTWRRFFYPTQEAALDALRVYLGVHPTDVVAQMLLGKSRVSLLSECELRIVSVGPEAHAVTREEVLNA